MAQRDKMILDTIIVLALHTFQMLKKNWQDYLAECEDHSIWCWHVWSLDSHEIGGRADTVQEDDIVFEDTEKLTEVITKTCSVRNWVAQRFKKFTLKDVCVYRVYAHFDLFYSYRI